MAVSKIIITKDLMDKVIEELNEYREIGTVEGYERAIQSSIENYNLYREYKAKVQQYEAIGTVEELQSMKDNGAFTGVELAQLAAMQMKLKDYEAIGTVQGYEDAIKSSIDNYNLMREYKAKVKEFEAIGTIGEFKALKEKSVAKKPIYKNLAHYCPTCNGQINDIEYNPFCDCGQNLDWQ